MTGPRYIRGRASGLVMVLWLVGGGCSWLGGTGVELPTVPPEVAGQAPAMPDPLETPDPSVPPERRFVGLAEPWEGVTVDGVDVVDGRPPFEVALEVLGRDAGVLAYRKDFVARDPWRLALVDELLASPLEALALLDREEATIDPRARLARARRELGLAPASPPAGLPIAAGIDPNLLLASVGPDTGWHSHPDLVDLLVGVLGELVVALQEASVHSDAAFARIGLKERDALALVARGLPLGLEWADIDATLAMLGRVDLARAADAADTLTDAALALASELSARGLDEPWGDGPWPPIVFEHPVGTIVVGGPDDDLHRGVATAVIDIGGDDLYLGLEPHPGHAMLVTVDASGDDLYRAEHTGGAGTGLLSVSVAVDVAGNDTYAAPGPGLAAGVGGVGILVDLAGDDRYASERMGQGAGMGGIGLLVDRAGDDLYTTSVFGQGFGGPGGHGALLDGGGDDRYVAGMVNPDHREETGAFHSFSQGYAMGLRVQVPGRAGSLASGGVGWLEDLEGDDTYLASYFAQGASYWYGLGALVDRAGADRYVARRYAQGTGVHASVGLLDDRRGDDQYVSWAVSQGCGHDLSVGVLRDGAGRDAYRGSWFVQGVGNDNSVGLLLDAGGGDLYEAESEEAQGWASLSRGAVGFGLLLDGGGEDFFEGPARPPLWTGGTYGVGVDGSGPMPIGPPPAAPAP